MLEGIDPPLPERVTLASDAERDATMTILRGHCADGRLTLDEFADRVEVVLAARTRQELAATTSDLPATTPPRPTTAPPRPGPTTTVVGILSGGVRKGRWRPGHHVSAFAFWGGCHLDLRNAELESSEIEIHAVAIMGGIEIIVPDGVEVVLDAVGVMGGVQRIGGGAPARPGMPVVRVTGLAFWGGITVRSTRSGEHRAQDRLKALRDEVGPRLADSLERVAEAHLDRLEERLDRSLDRSTDRHAGGRHDRHRADRAPRSRDVAPATRAAADGDDRSLERVADAVRRQGRQATSLPDGTVTILFTDIEGFTAMTEELGDLRAQEVLRAHNAIIRTQVRQCGGHEVKSQGDSFMVTFAGAGKGVRCAVGIQRAFARWTEDHPEQPLRVRIGLHTGEAIREADDLFGRSVIMAARIAAEAIGGEVLVSSLLKELTESSGEFVFHEPMHRQLKGLVGEHVLYPVEWKDDGLPPLLGRQ